MDLHAVSIKKVNSKRLPVYAGMPTNRQGSNKMSKVGYEIFENTYFVLSDGDEILTNTKRIKRVIF